MVLTLLIALFYALLSLYIWFWWQKIPSIEIPSGYSPQLSFSLIIAIRNEEGVLPNLINQIRSLDYPADNLEVILVNDFSTDSTSEILDGIDDPLIRVIHLANIPGKAISDGGKKQALKTGISNSTHPMIVTTDADCSFSPNWLRVLSWCYESSEAICLLGPVCFAGQKTLFDWFQRFDQLGLMAYTGAGAISRNFHMGNGANLSFSRDAFEHIGGYSNHLNHASGDDIFLVQAMARHYPGQIKYIKHPDAVATTQPENSIKGFIEQRIRWGSKARFFEEKIIKLVLSFQFLYACVICATALMFLVGIKLFLKAFLILAGTKLILDTLVLWRTARDLDQPFNPIYLLPASLIHNLYLTVGGILSLRKRHYRWKGRTHS